jgi:hypothetical protein
MSYPPFRDADFSQEGSTTVVPSLSDYSKSRNNAHCSARARLRVAGAERNVPRWQRLGIRGTLRSAPATRGFRYRVTFLTLDRAKVAIRRAGAAQMDDTAAAFVRARRRLDPLARPVTMIPEGVNSGGVRAPRGYWRDLAPAGPAVHARPCSNIVQA